MKPFDRRRQVYKKVYKPQRQRIKLLNYLNHGEAKHKEEPRASRQIQPTNTREQTKQKPHAPIRGIPRQIEIPRDFYHCIPPDLTSLEISLLEFDHDTGAFSIENSDCMGWEKVVSVGEGEEEGLAGSVELGDPNLAWGPALPVKLRVWWLGIWFIVSL